jgi:hypothetical protein
LYLLETLPGVKARSLLQITGKRGVISYFNLKWYDRGKSTVAREKLRDALGSNYDSSYADFLRYIDPQEILLAEAQPIGEGSYGKVYRASWMRKPSGIVGQGDTVCGDIALKIVHSAGQVNASEKLKFFGEVS